MAINCLGLLYVTKLLYVIRQFYRVTRGLIGTQGAGLDWVPGSSMVLKYGDTPS